MKRAHGFTLIELVITVVVGIVLMSIAIPSFRFMMANNRATTQANLLYTTLNYARSEALGRRGGVTVCPKKTADIAETDCGTNTDWANGWHVFTDDGSAGSIDAGDLRIKHQEPLSGAATLTTSEAYIGFDRDGAKVSVKSDEVTIAISEAGTTSDVSRCIRVNPIGSLRVHKITAMATCP